jgi:hypothetical protein
VLPTLDWLLHLDDSPTPNENRSPAPFPEWDGTAATLQPFLAGLESWFDDHFGFRKKLVRMHGRWKAKLFGESSSADVLTGRDGWLYFAGGRMIDNYVAAKGLGADELGAWQTLLETRRDWLAERGIAYLFVVAPNKETIYPEHLPEWLARKGAQTKLDQFVAHMRAHSSVAVLDLRPVLIAAKQTALTYFRTDSHWNALGAFVSAQAVVDAVGRQLPGGLEGLGLEDYALEFVDESAGDLVQMHGGEFVSSGRTTPKLTPRPPLAPLEIHTAPDLLDWVGGPHCVPVYTEREGPRRRVLLFRDSFAEGWRPFLGQHFARAVYVTQFYWDAALIERERPDVVVDEVVERHLNEGKPRELIEKDGVAR